MTKRLFLSLLLILFSAQPLFGQWRSGGLPVCTAPNYQVYPNIVSDGAGGAIIIWKHGLDEAPYEECRAQRVDADGFLCWGMDGVVVVDDYHQRSLQDIMPDGEGGAIFVFMYQYGVDDKDLYAQRVSGYGVRLWPAGGRIICNENNEQQDARCVSDGSGGAIIVWEDSRYGPQDTYAQRISGAGICLWADDGIPISLAGGNARGQEIATDGSDGAIMIWQDSRLGDWDIFAQRVDPDGTVYWADNGIVICSETDMQMDPRIVSDGAHGGIIVWEDWRDGYENSCLYAQKVNPSGNVMWDGGGETVCVLGTAWSDFEVIPDGSGGAIVTWVKEYNDDYSIYAQRIDGNGDVIWGADGIVVSDMTGTPGGPKIVSDGVGGAIIMWMNRNIIPWEVYAQRFDENGNALWRAGGIIVCEEADYSSFPEMTSDGAAGTIVTWGDDRGVDSDIYAQKIDADGYIVVDSDIPAASCRLFGNYPNPFNPVTTVQFYLSERSYVKIDIYDVTGAHVKRLASGFYEEGLHLVPWNGSTDDGRALSSGIYFCRLSVGAEVVWQKMVLVR